MHAADDDAMSMLTPCRGLRVPDGLRFADLHVARSESGDLDYDIPALTRVASASARCDCLLADDSLDWDDAALIWHWYALARANGEPADAVMESLRIEAQASRDNDQWDSPVIGHA